MRRCKECSKVTIEEAECDVCHHLDIDIVLDRVEQLGNGGERRAGDRKLAEQLRKFISELKEAA